MSTPRLRYRGVMSDSARWDGFVHRPGDIVISTAPKCGTTWAQMMCALLIFQTTTFDQPLDLISPWLDMQTRALPSILADLEGQRHRRFIKTHTPLDGLPEDTGVTYLCVGRDPRDVFLSWDNHVANNDAVAMFTARFHAVGLDDIMDKLAEGPPVRPEQEIDRFWEWVDDEKPVTETHNLAATLHHLSTFWAARHRANVVLLHYDDLIADTEQQMRQLATALDISVDESRWPALIRAASFEHMRDRAEVIAPEATSGLWYSNQEFFHSGTSGQWRRLLDDADIERYTRRVRELAEPDLAAWVHRGEIAG